MAHELILFTELGFITQRSTSLYCDNKTFISIYHNPVQYAKTKHVGVDRHFIKDHLKSNYISNPFVKTKDQLADVLTKGLSGYRFSYIVSKLGCQHESAGSSPVNNYFVQKKPKVRSVSGPPQPAPCCYGTSTG